MCPTKGRGNRVGVLDHPDKWTWQRSTWFFASDSNRCIGHLEGLGDFEFVKSCSGNMRLGRKRTPSHGGPTRPCRRMPKEGTGPPPVDTAVAVAVAVAVAARGVWVGDVPGGLWVIVRGGLDTL